MFERDTSARSGVGVRFFDYLFRQLSTLNIPASGFSACEVGGPTSLNIGTLDGCGLLGLNHLPGSYTRSFRETLLHHYCSSS